MRLRFEINQIGNIIGGKPIISRCPNCNNNSKYPNSGVVECSDCKMAFEIDCTGRYQLIKATCPKCNILISYSDSGNVECTECECCFKIDDFGRNINIRTRCPSCEELSSFENIGSVYCPECNWSYEIDDEGSVIGGIPINATCPDCDETSNFAVLGEVECPVCDFLFVIDVIIKTTCPNCQKSTCFGEKGEVKCPYCRLYYEIDQNGVAISDILDLTTEINENIESELYFQENENVRNANSVSVQVELIELLSFADNCLQSNTNHPAIQKLKNELITKVFANYAGERISFIYKNIQIPFRWCPPGQFKMGDKQLDVKLTRGFWMAETQVTQKLYRAVRGTNPSCFKNSYNPPVEKVSWEDANDFVNELTLKLSAQLTKDFHFSLPTEAEWEYACRAGSDQQFCFGNNEDSLIHYACYAGNEQGTISVGMNRPNTWGLYDMHGNVWEWCADWYDDILQGEFDPLGPANGSARVIRGGSWLSIAAHCRASYRSKNDPSLHLSTIGFRPILSLPSVSKHADEKKLGK